MSSLGLPYPICTYKWPLTHRRKPNLTYSLKGRENHWNVGHFEWRHLINRNHTTALLKAFPGKFTYVFSPKFTVCFSYDFHWKESSLFQLMVGWLMSNTPYQNSYSWRLNAQPGPVFHVLAPDLLSWASLGVSTEQAWSLLSWSVFYLANCSLLSSCSRACPEQAPSDLVRQPNSLSVIFWWTHIQCLLPVQTTRDQQHNEVCVSLIVHNGRGS